jgi:hypothetical protein
VAVSYTKSAKKCERFTLSGFFAGFVDYEKRHAVATCRWCGEHFVRYFAQWVCPTAECQERCAAHAVVRNDPQEGASPFLYLPLPLQVEIEEHPARRLLVEGPAGYGKSYSARWSLYKLCMKYKGFRALLLRCTYDQLEKNHLQHIDDEISHFENARFKRGTQEPKHVVFGDTQARLYFGYCQHKTDVAQFRGPEYDRIVLEEASEFVEDAITFIPTRDRGSNQAREAMLADGKDHGTTRLLTNPGGRSALLLRDLYIDRKPDPDEFPHYNPADYASISGRVEDNPYLAANHKSSGLGGLDAATYQQQAEGRWDVFPGQFFPDWRNDQHVRHIESIGDSAYVGVLLYGYNAPGVLFLARTLADGRLHIEHEWKFKQQTIPQTAERAKAILAERGITKIRLVCPQDMADTKQADTLQAEAPRVTFGRNGVTLIPVDADAHGWSRVHDYLRMSPHGTPWLTVSPSCVYLSRTLPTLIADDKHPDELANAQDDRAALALRTLVASRPQPGTKPVVKSELPQWSLGWWKKTEQRPRGLLSLGRS